ncbi:MAG TPA: hypothetical protein VIV11_18315, partial [Kofleriaceae bacterium]
QLVQNGAFFGPKQTMSILVHPVTGPTIPDPIEPDPAGGGGGCASGFGSLGLLAALRRRRR